MHDLELRGRALELIDAGVNDCEVGRRLGVARTTVRHWR
ncbi:MAG: helix-turn-helix domain-containing protein, partial [Solirubrobacteraceae bacterium]